MSMSNLEKYEAAKMLKSATDWQSILGGVGGGALGGLGGAVGGSGAGAILGALAASIATRNPKKILASKAGRSEAQRAIREAMARKAKVITGAYFGGAGGFAGGGLAGGIGGARAGARLMGRPSSD